MTVVAVAGPIFAVAQDGPRIGWRACNESVVRDLATRKELRHSTSYSLTGPDCGGTSGKGLAVAGTRVVWTEATSGIKDYLSVAVGIPGGGKPHRLRELVNDQYGEGDVWSDVIADGGTVVQGRIRWARDEACVKAHDGDRFECPALLVGGGVWRILDRSAVRVPKAPATIRLAVAGDRLALVPAQAGDVIEVRNMPTGDLISRTPVEGQPAVLALAPSVAAVLVKTPGVRILVLDPTAGAIRRTISVPTATAPALALAGRTLIYRVGLRLWRVDTVTGRREVAALTGSKAVSFSLEGRRLAWVETHRGRSRVRTAILPG